MEATTAQAVSLADLFSREAADILKEDWRRRLKINARLKRIRSLLAEAAELSD
jgi:hypothetical protein